MILDGLLNMLFYVTVIPAFGIFAAAIVAAFMPHREHAASPPPRECDLLEWLRANQDN